jgi:hypothetical protein
VGAWPCSDEAEVRTGAIVECSGSIRRKNAEH